MEAWRQGGRVVGVEKCILKHKIIKLQIIYRELACQN